MNKSMLWTIASILTLSGLAVFAYLLWRKTPITVGSFDLRDLTNIATLLVAIFSLYIAVAAYQKSVKDSEEQQKSLDASRAQLQAVVEAATGQQEILNRNLEISRAQQELLDKSLQTSRVQQEIQSKNLETTKAQFNLLSEREKREKEREARKPIGEVRLLLTTEGEVPLDEVSKRSEVEFNLEKGMKWGRATFLVRNAGDTELLKPFVVITASPNSVFVDHFDQRMSERPDHNSYTFPVGRDIEPFSLAKIQYFWKADITVPDSVDRFDLAFSFHGANLARQQWKLHFKVIRDKA